MSKQAESYYEFGPFRLDASERLLLREGQLVPLTPKSFDTLLALVRESGHVLERGVLMKTIWPDTFVEENNLTQTISALRKALGESSTGRKYIETISRRGYRFVASVKQSRQEDGNSNPVRPADSKPAEAQAATRTIAVLPFKTLGAENDNEYLGMGMADALITRLTSIRQIVVRPTSAVLKYTDPAQDAMAAGRELGVDMLLVGCVQRSADQIRVTVQLVSARDQSPVWAEKFDENFTSIFAVQDSISEQVTRALMLKLSGEEHKQLVKRHTENIAAYQLYLKGRYCWNKRTEWGLKKGVEYFQQAIDLDPCFALAYAGQADCYLLLGELSYWAPKESLPKAKAAALKALEIDESLAEAHTSLSDAKLYFDWDVPGAERGYRRAIELNPNYETAHHWYAWQLLALERFDEAISEIKRAHELDPLSPVTNTIKGLPFYFARDYDRAIELFQKALEMEPSFPMAHYRLGLAYAQKGRYEEAIAEYKRAAQLEDNPTVLAFLGCAYAALGDTGEVQKVLDELKEQSARRYISPYFMAIINASLGEKEMAMKWLEKAEEERSCWLVWLRIDPLVDNLRRDSRFQSLLKRVGLSD